MRCTFCLLFFWAACFLLKAQSVRRPVAAAYLGSEAYSTSLTDVFSFTNNEASLAALRGPAAGVYGEERFMLGTVGYYCAAAGLPTPMGNFGVAIDYFGYKNYNESNIGMAYGRSLGPKLDLGIRFNYFMFRIPTYQNASAVTFEIGAIAHFTDQLNAGIHIYNPVGGKLSHTRSERLGYEYSFGMGYEPSGSFFISAEIIKCEDYPVNIKAGVQYRFAGQFFAKAGVNTEHSSPYAGAGIAWDHVRMDVSASYHPQLGLSPGLLFIVNFKPVENEAD